MRLTCPPSGVCNVPFNAKVQMLELLGESGQDGVPPDRTELLTLGLNHLSWHRGLEVGGRDLWPQVLKQYLQDLRQSADPEWEPATIESLGMIPNYYLEYYYHTHRKLAAQRDWPPSRAEEVMAIEKELLDAYAEPGRTEPPEGLMQRGGAYYSTVATQLLNAHYNDLGETHVLNVPHRGAVPGWPADWVLEMPCQVGQDGILPIPARPLPPVCFGLLAQVKSYEILTVEAAVRGDRSAAYQALLAHPLGPTADRVQTVLEDLLATHRAHLPQFWQSALAEERSDDALLSGD